MSGDTRLGDTASEHPTQAQQCTRKQPVNSGHLKRGGCVGFLCFLVLFLGGGGGASTSARTCQVVVVQQQARHGIPQPAGALHHATPSIRAALDGSQTTAASSASSSASSPPCGTLRCCSTAAHRPLLPGQLGGCTQLTAEWLTHVKRPPSPQTSLTLSSNTRQLAQRTQTAGRVPLSRLPARDRLARLMYAQVVGSGPARAQA